MPDAKPDNSTRERIDALSDKFDVVHKRIDKSSAELQQEIDKKFDEAKLERVADKEEVAAKLEATEARHERSERRSAKRIGWYITISIAVITLICGLCTWLISAYLTSVHDKLGDMTTSIAATNSEIKNLAEKHSRQSIEFARFGERLEHHAEFKVRLEKLDSENDKLEERLRLLERAIRP